MKTTQDKIDYLRLVRSENVGRSTFFRLIDIFSSASKALEQVYDFAKEGGLNRKINILSKDEAEKEIIATQKFGAEIITFDEEIYPQLLREIPDPAPILTIKGKTEFFLKDSIAVVGPRNASFNGLSFAKKIAGDLGQNSIVVTSGLARGVDASAHKAALATGTIAVIAGGIDNIYPTENKELFSKISTQGLLISEQSFGSPPKPANFVQRNRLISGLSLGVIIVEAGMKSGSLTTARFAAEQGREVFAVPGSPLDPRSFGTNRLIKDGAKMVENIDDVLEDFLFLKTKFNRSGKLSEPESEDFQGLEIKMPSDVDIKKIREEIFSKLSSNPISIEEIIEELQLSSRLVNIAVVQLELANKIEVNFGKVVLKIE